MKNIARYKLAKADPFRLLLGKFFNETGLPKSVLSKVTGIGPSWFGDYVASRREINPERRELITKAIFKIAKRMDGFAYTLKDCNEKEKIKELIDGKESNSHISGSRHKEYSLNTRGNELT